MIARPRATLACCAMLAGVAAGCSPGAAGSVTAQGSQSIQGGTSDTTHTAVVGIVLQTSQGIALCSGSLIAPNLVLTARHCVSQLSSEEFVCQAFTDASGAHAVTSARAPYAASQFAVTTDAQLGRDSDFVYVAEVLVPPGTTNTALCGADIAMLRLATPIDGAGLIVPRLDLAPTTSDVFTAVGYGGTDGQGDNSGERRQRGGLDVQYVGMAFASDGTTQIAVTTANELIADTGTCEGDSGSPALDALGQTFGVLSRGDANTCDQPIYTRVDAYAAWIRQGAMDAAQEAGQAPQPWVTPPSSGTANMGDDCLSDDQCVIPLVCLVVGDRRRCTSTDCTACPTGWICGDAGAGQACVPDPSMPEPPATTTDGGTATGDGSSADGSTSTATHSGCSVASTGHGRDGGWAIASGLALGFAAVSRRRRARR